MKKEILLAVLPLLVFANVAKASTIGPETDATLCYMRWPRLIDLSYTMCGASRTNPNPVRSNPSIYGTPLNPGTAAFPPSPGDTPCQNSWQTDSRGRTCGNRAADKRPGGK